MIGGMNNETRERLEKMLDAKPIENPCPEMADLGYNYQYIKGLVDATPHYTRVEEDFIRYIGDKYIIQFNLASRGMVLIMKENNAEYYSNRPTFFITGELTACINKITHELGWDD